MNMNVDRIVFTGTVMVAVLSGCSPYWTKAAWGPQPAPTVIERPGPFMCGKSLAIGCYHADKNLIEIQSNLPQFIKDCVMKHEISFRERVKHSLGWQHDDRGTYALDCGDGTVEFEPR